MLTHDQLVALEEPVRLARPRHTRKQEHGQPGGPSQPSSVVGCAACCETQTQKTGIFSWIYMELHISWSTFRPRLQRGTQPTLDAGSPLRNTRNRRTAGTTGGTLCRISRLYIILQSIAYLPNPVKETAGVLAEQCSRNGQVLTARYFDTDWG